MKLPFTIEQFLEVFKNYNTTFYPLQGVFLLLAAYVIFLLVRNKSRSGKIITIILAILWLWMGAAYHIAFFSVINKAAYIFGSLFILQGILFFRYGLINRPSFAIHKNIAGVVSVSLIFYALLIYPLIGYFSGHGYPFSPTFGLPCPTTIFTLAVLIVAKQSPPLYIIIIPVLWSVIGFSAAFSLGIYEDLALIVSGLAFIILFFINRKSPHVCQPLAEKKDQPGLDHGGL